MIQTEFQLEMDFDNPKVYGDTSIFDGIVGGNLYVREIQMLFN